MPNVLAKVAVLIVVLVAIVIMIALVRWAKKGGRGASALGSVLLFLGWGLAPRNSEQRIEEARESKDRRGAESGDRP